MAAALCAAAASGPALGQDADSAVLPTAQTCPGSTPITVRAALAADVQAACDGAQRAIRFMGQAGLQPPASATVDIVEQLPGDMKGLAVGCYARDTRRIALLSYPAFEAGGRWFRLPASRELYRSAAAHEMAHAVVACNAGPVPLPVPAHEYVAYVVMFATMDPALRERVLARFPGAGFDNILQINTIVYISNPSQFAVDAWRHYLKRRDRAGWLRDMVAGRVVQDFPVEGP